MNRPPTSMLAAALTMGLAFGWVAGSVWPWSAPAVVLLGVACFGWLVFTHLQLQKDINDWEQHAQTAKRLLDEAETDEET